MTVRAYYATHDLAAFEQYRVLLLDDENPEDYGLISTGYVQQLVTPEPPHAPEDQD